MHELIRMNGYRKDNVVKNRTRRTGLLFWGIVFLGAMMLTGCMGPASQPEIQYYALAYQKPDVTLRPTLPVSIRINSVQTTSFYHTSRMAWATSPYNRGLYNYYYWEDSADKLLRTYVMRSIAEGQMFSDMITAESTTPSRFALTLFLDEFLEMDRGSERYAVVSFMATLEWESDNIPSRMGQTGRFVVFQKNYQVETPLQGKTLTALAQGMSQSVFRATQELQKDLYNKITTALLDSPPPAPVRK